MTTHGRVSLTMYRVHLAVLVVIQICSFASAAEVELKCGQQEKMCLNDIVEYECITTAPYQQWSIPSHNVDIYFTSYDFGRRSNVTNFKFSASLIETNQTHYRSLLTFTSDAALNNTEIACINGYGNQKKCTFKLHRKLPAYIHNVIIIIVYFSAVPMKPQNVKVKFFISTMAQLQGYLQWSPPVFIDDVNNTNISYHVEASSKRHGYYFNHTTNEEEFIFKNLAYSYCPYLESCSIEPINENMTCASEYKFTVYASSTCAGKGEAFEISETARGMFTPALSVYTFIIIVNELPSDTVIYLSHAVINNSYKIQVDIPWHSCLYETHAEVVLLTYMYPLTNGTGQSESAMVQTNTVQLSRGKWHSSNFTVGDCRFTKFANVFVYVNGSIVSHAYKLLPQLETVAPITNLQETPQEQCVDQTVLAAISTLTTVIGLCGMIVSVVCVVIAVALYRKLKAKN